MTTHKVGITRCTNDRFRAYCLCKWLGETWYVPANAAYQAVQHRENVTQGQLMIRQQTDDAKQLCRDFFAAEEALIPQEANEYVTVRRDTIQSMMRSLEEILEES